MLPEIGLNKNFLSKREPAICMVVLNSFKCDSYSKERTVHIKFTQTFNQDN